VDEGRRLVDMDVTCVNISLSGLLLLLIAINDLLLSLIAKITKISDKLLLQHKALVMDQENVQNAINVKYRSKTIKTISQYEEIRCPWMTYDHQQSPTLV